MHELPDTMARLWREQEELTQEVAIWLAKSLALAHPRQDDRDSPALRDASVDCPKLVPPRGPLVGTHARPDAGDPLCIVGERRPHEPERVERASWRCKLCRRPGDSAASFASTWCYGQHQLLSRVHVSHKLMMHAGDQELISSAVVVLP